MQPNSNGVFTEFKANLALIEAQNAFLALKKRFDELKALRQKEIAEER